MSRHIFKMEEPVHLTFSYSLGETYAYFDVGIGKVDFSLSVFAKFSGVVTVELLYGGLSLGILPSMQGVGGISGTVTTTGTYEDNPGPYLTARILGVPDTGFTASDVVLTLRPTDPDNYTPPDSYADPVYFDMDGPTPRPWMTILTTPWFRGNDPTEPEHPDCSNFATPAPIYGMPWSPVIGSGNNINWPTLPPNNIPINGGRGGATTTTPIPVIVTLPPTFPPNPSILAPDDVDPPEFPGVDDPTLPGYLAPLMIGDLSDLGNLDTYFNGVVGTNTLYYPSLANSTSGFIIDFTTTI